MKKLFTVLTLIMFAGSGLTYGQGWEEVTSGTTKILYGLSIPPGQSDIVYACGMQGTYDGPGEIIKSEDGGLTWTSIFPTSGEIDGLQAICFIDEDTGFAGGWNNYFIKTTDGGATWSEVTVGSNIWYFTDIEFWDDENGVAIAQMDGGGQPVFITDDGGDTWTQATSGVNQVPLGISYASSTTLFLVGTGGTIDKSTDGGYTWNTNNSPGGITFGVDFSGTGFGVVGAEDGLMMATTNGGQSWSSYSTGYENLWAAWAFPSDSAFVGGTDADIYKTTDQGQTWTLVNSGGSTAPSLYNIKFAQNGTGIATGSQGKIFYKEASLSVDFVADFTTICAGGSVNFTDLSAAAIGWEWEFEGGTPATSTEQNPTVTYNSGGTYNVKLTVTDGATYISETKVNYIEVLLAPSQADKPEGEEDICTSGYYSYTTEPVEYAESYEWSLEPAAAGTITGNTDQASLATADTYTGEFTITVRALNQCGTGDWSDEFTGSVSQAPQEYSLEGGGEYCLNGDGVEITLSDSDTGNDYELYFEAEPTGNIVAGTGSEISFGLLTEEGSYTCVGYNDNCSLVMINQVEVIILYPPTEPGMPNGPAEVCNMETSEYTSGGAGDAESYSWTLIPEEAGTLTADGLSATIEWNNSFEGQATLSITGSNDCGEGQASSLEIEVGSGPAPVVSGEPVVCKLQVEDYMVAEHDGSSYTWMIAGGTITAGEGTYMVSVTWGEPGEGTLYVEEETSAGCMGTSETFVVTIDDCTGIDEFINNSEVRIFPNPAASLLNVQTSNTVNGQFDLLVLNQLGQIVAQQNYTANNEKFSAQLEISSLSEGLYILQIKKGGEILANKQFLKK